MNAPTRLDRKARMAVLAVAFVFLAIIGIAMRSCATAMAPQSIISQSAPSETQVITIGSQTVFLERGSVGSRISQWLNSQAAAPRAFNLDDSLFAPGSDRLTKEGTNRVRRLADLMKSNTLNATVYVTTYEGSNAIEKRELATKRAERVRRDMIERGAPASQITAAAAPLSTSESSKSQPPTMVLVLSKTAE